MEPKHADMKWHSLIIIFYSHPLTFVSKLLLPLVTRVHTTLASPHCTWNCFTSILLTNQPLSNIRPYTMSELLLAAFHLLSFFSKLSSFVFLDPQTLCTTFILNSLLTSCVLHRFAQTSRFRPEFSLLIQHFVTHDYLLPLIKDLCLQTTYITNFCEHSFFANDHIHK